jgi:hypothetical protein
MEEILDTVGRILDTVGRLDIFAGEKIVDRLALTSL